MKCPNCHEDMRNLKKYKVTDCRCGRRLILIEIKKAKQVVDVTPDKEDKNEL